MSKKGLNNLERQRLAKWQDSAKSIQDQPVWTERRLAIDIGGHTFIVGNGQIFQCLHCGHYDPEWSATEVLAYYKDNFGIKPREIEVTCSVAEIPNK